MSWSILLRCPLLVLCCCLGAGAVDGISRLHASSAEVLDASDPACWQRAMAATRSFWASPPDGDAAVGLVRHRVRAGDTWVRLGRLYHVSSSFLHSLNGARRLVPGSTVRVLDLHTQPLRLEVRRHAFCLLAWRGPVLLGVYPIGLGTPDHPTPLGTTVVSLCVRHPDWRDPVSRRVYHAGDPRNVLGGYWLAFAPGDGRFRGIGMHGYTAQKESRWLGRPGSRGCIRLTQADISWLFSLVRPGVRVCIRD